MFRYYIILFLNTFLTVFSQVLLKSSAIEKNATGISQYLNFKVITGYFIMLCVIAINIFLVSKISMNTVNTISETFPLVLSVFAGVFFFNETIDIKKIISILLIFIGIIIVLI